MRQLRIAVLSGGPSSEHDVSLASGRQVAKHLDRNRYKVTTIRLGRRENPVIRLRPLQHRTDIVFLALHGAFGEDGTIQALLDALQIPYTGSGPAASALAMDKHLSCLVFQAAGFQVPSWNVAETVESLPKMRLPVVVKPVNAGSSVDTYIAKNRTSYHRAAAAVIKKYGRVMVQQFVRGREITCGVLEDRRGRPFALPPTEIIPKSSTWFDYKAKYTKGASQEITPAPLTTAQTKMIQRLSLQAHQLLGCSGMSRTDFIFDGRRFWVLELNTIPGLTETSLLPQGAAAAGLSYAQMINGMIQAARRKKNNSPE